MITRLRVQRESQSLQRGYIGKRKDHIATRVGGAWEERLKREKIEWGYSNKVYGNPEGRFHRG